MSKIILVCTVFVGVIVSLVRLVFGRGTITQSGIGDGQGSSESGFSSSSDSDGDGD
jgi:hypothetical protein